MEACVEAHITNTCQDRQDEVLHTFVDASHRQIVKGIIHTRFTDSKGQGFAVTKFAKSHLPVSQKLNEQFANKPTSSQSSCGQVYSWTS